MRYFDHDMSEPGAFAYLLWGIFERCICNADGLLTGCARKWDMVTSGRPPFTLFDREIALQNLINVLLDMCKDHYGSLDLQDYQKHHPSTFEESSVADPSQYLSAEYKGAVTKDVPLDELSREFLEEAKLARVKAETERKPVLDSHNPILGILYHALKEARWSHSRDMRRDNLSEADRITLIDRRSESVSY